jgi:hypothetical protein
MPGIFISYRRDDSQGFAGRLAGDLEKRFGSDRVFLDIEIPIGSDFSDVLHRAIAASDVLLVVIGRRWAGASAGGHASRLYEPNDWVRTEIESAFAQSKHVVPVLVGGARMPDPASLPASIRALAQVQAAAMSDRHWADDIAGLADHLAGLVPALRDRATLGVGVSPAAILRELGERLVDEVSAGREVQPRSAPPGLFKRMVRAIGRRLGGWLGSAVLLVTLYVGLRLFGDDEVLATLDAFEARLQIGWQRLQQYLQRLMVSG